MATLLQPFMSNSHHLASSTTFTSESFWEKSKPPSNIYNIPACLWCAQYLVPTKSRNTFKKWRFGSTKGKWQNKPSFNLFFVWPPTDCRKVRQDLHKSAYIHSRNYSHATVLVCSTYLRARRSYQANRHISSTSETPLYSLYWNME